MANRKYLMKYHIGSCNRAVLLGPLCTNWEALGKNSDAAWATRRATLT